MKKKVLALAIEALENQLAEVKLEIEAIRIILKEEIEGGGAGPANGRRNKAGAGRRNPTSAKTKAGRSRK